MRAGGGKLLFVVGLVLGARGAVAQDRDAQVIGTVADGEGRGLDGATIEILGTKLSATSGENGRFRFGPVRPGRYWILARRVGYAPIRMTATLQDGQTRALSLTLEKIPQRLSELTVLAHGGMSGYRHQDFLARSRSAFGTFLTRDDLDRIGGHDLVSVVQRYLPGKTRYTLERRTGETDLFGGRLYRRLGSGRLYARDGRQLLGRCLLQPQLHPFDLGQRRHPVGRRVVDRFRRRSTGSHRGLPPRPLGTDRVRLPGVVRVRARGSLDQVGGAARQSSGDRFGSTRRSPGPPANASAPPPRRSRRSPARRATP